MAPRKSGSFHQSVRAFQTTRFSVGWDSNGVRKTQWRMEPRPVDVVPEPADRMRAPREQFSSGNYTRSRMPSQGPFSNEQGTFKSNLDAGHGPSRKFDLVDRSSQSTKALHNAGETISIIRPPSNQMNSPPSRDESPRRSRGTAEPAGHRQPLKSTVTQVGSDRRNSTTVNAPQRDLHVHSHAQHVGTALPVPVSANPEFAALRNKNVVRQGALRDYDPGRVAAIGVGRHETESRKARTIAGTGSQRTMNSTFAPPGKQPRTDSRDQEMPRLGNVTGIASAGPRDSGSSEPGSAQTSGVTGEIWMDTLSLRDWLHAYLTSEIGRASRAQTMLSD